MPKSFSLMKITLGAAGVLALSAFAAMHLHLTASVPAADSRVATAPSALTLTFSEAPEVAMSRVRLVRADSSVVPTGKVAAGAAPLSLTVPVTGPVQPGTYIVNWRAASKDGHAVSGHYSFAVTGAAAAAGPSTTSRDHTGH